MQGILNLSDTNFNFFYPNKEIVVSIDNTSLSKYNGSYRVSKMSAKLAASGGIMCSSVAVTILGYGGEGSSS